MTEPLSLDDLTVNEREQFEKAVAEGNDGDDEWKILMMLATANGGSAQGAHQRRQAIRQLYKAELERRSKDGAH